MQWFVEQFKTYLLKSNRKNNFNLFMFTQTAFYVLLDKYDNIYE